MSVQEGTICLVGAGLGNGILAWFLRKRHPQLKVVIYEAKPHMTENRTWSFHGADISEENRKFLNDLIVHQWPGYEVRFQSSTRRLTTEYATMTPERLQRELIRAGVDIQFSCSVTEVGEEFIVTADGRKHFFDCVIDGRGLQPSQVRMGYQKFVGLIIRFTKPHGLTLPILMDAKVPQLDGFRFFYCLPISERVLLVEDTRYSERSELNHKELVEEIKNYVDLQGWQIETVLKSESGVLPIPLRQAQVPSSSLQLGMQGSFFHPVTGYSLPDSVRLADRISSSPHINKHFVQDVIKKYREEQAFRKKFYLLLNRMMFLAAKDTERRKIFEHFYGLPSRTIERFYAGSTSFVDGIRILSGKPPVAIVPAVRAMFFKDKKETL